MKRFKTPTAVTTAILSLITIFFWAGFEVYHALTTKPVPPVPAEVINPIDPTLNTKNLDNISARTLLTDDEIGIVQLTTPTPITTPSPIATSSATSSPQATSSATPISTPTATP